MPAWMQAVSVPQATEGPPAEAPGAGPVAADADGKRNAETVGSKRPCDADKEGRECKRSWGQAEGEGQPSGGQRNGFGQGAAGEAVPVPYRVERAGKTGAEDVKTGDVPMAEGAQNGSVRVAAGVGLPCRSVAGRCPKAAIWIVGCFGRFIYGSARISCPFDSWWVAKICFTPLICCPNVRIIGNWNVPNTKENWKIFIAVGKSTWSQSWPII